MVEAKPVDPMVLGHGTLLRERLAQSQVVVPKIGGKIGFQVPEELRYRLRYVGPFRKARSPRRVVFGDWMKLGQKIRNDLGLWRANDTLGGLAFEIDRAVLREYFQILTERRCRFKFRFDLYAYVHRSKPERKLIPIRKCALVTLERNHCSTSEHVRYVTALHREDNQKVRSEANERPFEPRSNRT